MLGFTLISQVAFAFRGSPGARAIADFNGDGNLDIVVGGPAYINGAWTGETTAFKFFTVVNGQISEQSELINGGAIHAFEGIVGDLNGDGYKDFFSINSGKDDRPWTGEANTLMFGGSNGLKSGGYAGRVDYHHSGDVGDIDNDGDLDIYSGATFGQGNHAWAERSGPEFLINDGLGNFTSRAGGMSELPRQMLSSNLVDIDGDFDLDLVTGWEQGGPAASIYVNDGRGNFSKGADLGAGYFGSGNTLVNDVQTIDFDHDGDLDVVLAVTKVEPFYQGSAVQMFRNDGGSFTDVTAALGLNPSTPLGWISRIHATDMNGDGKADLVASRTSGEGTIYLSTGNGFDIGTGSQLSVQGVQWTPSDVNGDGFTDLVTFSRDIGGETLGLKVYTQVPSGAGTVGNDNIPSTSGNDTLAGRQGDDYLWGGEGNDVIIGGDGFDNTHGNKGEDTIYGGRGSDWVVGGQGSDLLFGEDGLDQVYGNMGNDTCYGGAGVDWVRGGQGDDILYGEDGNDWLSGDRGNDTIFGGSGADTFHAFVGSSIDRVMDFNLTQGDRIELEVSQIYVVRHSGRDTIVDLGAGDQIILVGQSLSDGDWIIN